MDFTQLFMTLKQLILRVHVVRIVLDISMVKHEVPFDISLWHAIFTRREACKLSLYQKLESPKIVEMQNFPTEIAFGFERERVVVLSEHKDTFKYSSLYSVNQMNFESDCI